MADLDLYGSALAARAFLLLVAGLDVAAVALGGDPGREEGRGVEVFLEVAQNLGRADAGRFVDCFEKKVSSCYT